MTVEELLRTCPVSEQARRAIMARLDAVAAVYRLAAAVAVSACPMRFRWYRAMPMDAAMTLSDGRTIAVVRQGRTVDRTAFSKRMWRLREAFRPGAILMLMVDETSLRHARRLMWGAPSIAFLALESDVLAAGTEARIWRTPSGPALLDLRAVLAHTGRRGTWPVEKPHRRASLPQYMALQDSETSARAWMLPALLKSTEKRALDLLWDWPWILPAHLAAMLGVRGSRLALILRQLEALGLIRDIRVDDRRRLGLSDRGLAVLTRRDRTAVGAARKRWRIALNDPKSPLLWSNVSGGRTRQLLRYAEHTDSVHWFVAVLSRQARYQYGEVVQIDPSRRASRYFRHGGGLRSIHPDAFGVLRRGKQIWPFFLEWERRAVRPVTMAERLAPYLNYYSSHRPIDDHGSLPGVLVVFEDEIAQTHFLRVAREEMARLDVRVPLRVATRSRLERVGPLGRAWSAPGCAEATCVLQTYPLLEHWLP